MEKWNNIGRSKSQKTEKLPPTKSMTRLTVGAQLTRLGPPIAQKSVNSRQIKTIHPITPITSVKTPSLWSSPWLPFYRIFTVSRTSEAQPEVHWLRLGVFTLNLIISSAQLLPAFFTAHALNIIIVMIGSTITVIVVSEGSKKTRKKYKWRKRGMRSIMMVLKWIKSRIKYDRDHKLTFGRHRTNQSKQTQSQTWLQEIHYPQEKRTPRPYWQPKGFEIRCFQIVSFSIKRLLQILKTISWVLEYFLKIRFSPPPGPVCKTYASTINFSSIWFAQLNNKNEGSWTLRDKSPPTFLSVSALSLCLRCLGSMWEILGSTPGRWLCISNFRILDDTL